MTDYIVAGAGTTACNGTYVENGTADNRPLYTKSDGKQIMWMGSRYMLGDANMYMDADYGPQGTRYYDSSGSGASPTPDTLTWTVAMHGSAPVPTVTAAGGGDPSSTINHIMHYRRLRELQ